MDSGIRDGQDLLESHSKTAKVWQSWEPRRPSGPYREPSPKKAEDEARVLLASLILISLLSSRLQAPTPRQKQKPLPFAEGLGKGLEAPHLWAALSRAPSFSDQTLKLPAPITKWETEE